MYVFNAVCIDIARNQHQMSESDFLKLLSDHDLVQSAEIQALYQDLTDKVLVVFPSTQEVDLEEEQRQAELQRQATKQREMERQETIKKMLDEQKKAAEAAKAQKAQEKAAEAAAATVEEKKAEEKKDEEKIVEEPKEEVKETPKVDAKNMDQL